MLLDCYYFVFKWQDRRSFCEGCSKMKVPLKYCAIHFYQICVHPSKDIFQATDTLFWPPRIMSLGGNVVGDEVREKGGFCRAQRTTPKKLGQRKGQRVRPLVCMLLKTCGACNIFWWTHVWRDMFRVYVEIVVVANVSCPTIWAQLVPIFYKK